MIRTGHLESPLRISILTSIIRRSMRMLINESNLTLALNWVNKAVTINSAGRDIDGAIACYQKVVDLLRVLSIM